MRPDYFSFLQLLATFIWLVIILGIAIVYRSSKRDQPHYRFFTLNVSAKLFFASAFSLVYIFVYQGGDTTAYFDGSVALNNLFFKSPELYFNHLFNESTATQFTADFDSRTGYPPSWIYREPEAFVVCKFMSIISFFSLKSYLAMTLITASLVSIASWKLFELLRTFKFADERLLALGICFLPSVNFWCSGISKDTWVFMGTVMLIYHSFKIISPQFKASIWNWIMLLFFGFIIYQIRSFILVATLIPLSLAVTTRVANKIGRLDYKIILAKIAIYAIGIFIILRLFSTTSEAEFLSSNSFLSEAAIIQQDFANNTTYGTNKYSLGDIQFTPVGLLRAMPASIVAGIYRPFLWEALSPTLIFNGLESTLFLLFTFLFFRRNAREKIRTIRRNEVLMFAIVFVFILAFMTGLTSGLFGVLVRLRALLLPFLFILLTVGIFPSSSSEGKPEESAPEL